MGNNASQTKKGFNYQDTVALAYFLKDIDRLDWINIEGIEDVDLHYSDKETTYVQAKMAENVNDKRRTSALKDCLRVLLQDYLTDKLRSKKFVYVTNSHYPLREQKDFDFSKDYVMYNYTSFNEVLHKSIRKQITNLKREEDKQGNTKYPEISSMSGEDIDKFLDKFAVTKFWYEGDDDESKLQDLDKRIQNFIASARIENKFFSSLKEGWYYMVVRSSESEKKKITKKEFVAHTFASISFEQVDQRTFFDKCDISYESQNYINSQTNEIENSFLSHFQIRPAIITLFSEYRRKNRSKKNLEMLVDFITENASKLDNIVNFSGKHKIGSDVAKFLAWIVVTQDSEFKNIKKVANYED